MKRLTEVQRVDLKNPRVSARAVNRRKACLENVPEKGLALDCILSILRG